MPSLFRRFQSHRKLQKMLHVRWQRIFVRTGHYINWAVGGCGFPHKVKGRGTGGGRRGTLDIRRGTRDMRRGTRAPIFGRAARPFAAAVPVGKHAVRAGGHDTVRAVVPRGMDGGGGLCGWDERDYRDERDGDFRDGKDKRERRMPAENVRQHTAGRRDPSPPLSPWEKHSAPRECARGNVRFAPSGEKNPAFFSRGGLQRGGSRCILCITPEIPGDAPWKRNSAI